MCATAHGVILDNMCIYIFCFIEGLYPRQPHRVISGLLTNSNITQSANQHKSKQNQFVQNKTYNYKHTLNSKKYRFSDLQPNVKKTTSKVSNSRPCITILFVRECCCCFFKCELPLTIAKIVVKNIILCSCLCRDIKKHTSKFRQNSNVLTSSKSPTHLTTEN